MSRVSSSSCAAVDLSGLDVSTAAGVLRSVAVAMQESLDLSRGIVLRVMSVEIGTPSHSRLLIVVHHLVSDRASLEILMAEIQGAYSMLVQGQAVRLPPATASFATWAAHLETLAQSPALDAEVGFWLEMATPVIPVPKDVASERNRVGDAATVKSTVDAAIMAPLLDTATSDDAIRACLLVALAESLAPWLGRRRVVVEMRAATRDAAARPLDVSCTIGWLTASFPMRVDLEDSGRENGHRIAIERLARRLAALPRSGLGYGLLRYGTRAIPGVERLRRQTAPEISFNFLGRHSQTDRTGEPRMPAPQPLGGAMAPDDSRVYALEIMTLAIDGALRVTWTYGPRQHHRQTIEELAATFVETLATVIATSVCKQVPRHQAAEQVPS